jgi:hypothetical protein
MLSRRDRNNSFLKVHQINSQQLQHQRPPFPTPPPPAARSQPPSILNPQAAPFCPLSTPAPPSLPRSCQTGFSSAFFFGEEIWSPIDRFAGFVHRCGPRWSWSACPPPPSPGIVHREGKALMEGASFSRRPPVDTVNGGPRATGGFMADTRHTHLTSPAASGLFGWEGGQRRRLAGHLPEQEVAPSRSTSLAAQCQ